MIKKEIEINNLIKSAAEYMRKAYALDGDSSENASVMRKHYAAMVNATFAYLSKTYGIDPDTSFERCENLNEAMSA